MKCPFARGHDETTDLREMERRLENVVFDYQSQPGRTTFYAVDFYLLFCEMVDHPTDPEVALAKQLFNSGRVRLIILPETLWELRAHIYNRIESLRRKANSEEMRQFMASEPVRRFLALMDQPRREWREVLRHYRKAGSDDQGRRCRQAIYQASQLRLLESKIQEISKHLREGRIYNLPRLFTELAIESPWPDGEIEPDRARAYQVLSHHRKKRYSDQIDASVYARIKWLGQRAAATNGARVYFLSHESMIDMLEHDRTVDQRVVRSFTDSSLLLNCWSDDKAMSPDRGSTASTSERINLAQVERMLAVVREVAPIESMPNPPKELRVKRMECIKQLDRLGDCVLGNTGRDLTMGEERGLRFLLESSASTFDRGLREFDPDSYDFNTDEKRYRDQIEALYTTISHIKDGTLDSYLAPVIRANQEAWEAAAGDRATEFQLELKALAEMSFGDFMNKKKLLEGLAHTQEERRLLITDIRIHILPQIPSPSDAFAVFETIKTIEGAKPPQVDTRQQAIWRAQEVVRGFEASPSAHTVQLVQIVVDNKEHQICSDVLHLVTEAARLSVHSEDYQDCIDLLTELLDKYGESDTV